MLYLPAALLFLYLFFRLVLPSGLSRVGKAAAAVALFLASQEHLLNGLFFGGLSAPDLPAWVLMLQGWLFTSLLFLFVLVLVRDVFCLASGSCVWRGAPCGGTNGKAPLFPSAEGVF